MEQQQPLLLTYQPPTPRLTEVALASARYMAPGGERSVIELPEGCTVAQMLQQVPADMLPFVRVFSHGVEVLDLDGYRPRAGESLLVCVVPQGGGSGGGKKILSLVATIVIAVFAPYIAGAFYAAGTVGYAAVAAAVTMVGSMAISALIKPPSISTDAQGIGSSAAPKSYQITGQSNQARPYQPCMVVYGRHKVLPTMAGVPNVDNWADQSQITALYDFGLGHVALEDLRIGDVSAWEYEPEMYFHSNSLCRDLHLYTRRLGYDQYSIVMEQNRPVTVRTKPDTFAADLDIQFPRGIFQQAKHGPIPMTADFIGWWSPAGANQWLEIPIDWYHGVPEKYYADPAIGGIRFRLSGVITSQWEVYTPWDSPARMRELAVQYWTQQGNNPAAGGTNAGSYAAATRNLMLAFNYPVPIDNGQYFNLNPTARELGWGGDAVSHFESIGSRTGANPGVAGVTITDSNSGVVYPYNPADVAQQNALRELDRRYSGGNQDIGGWFYLDNRDVVATMPPGYQNLTPFEWQADPGYFAPADYLSRYPDVAAAGMDPWQHFTKYGAFEGRDPFAAGIIRRVVRVGVAHAGTYWLRISVVFPSPGDNEIRIQRTDAIKDGSDTSIAVATNGEIQVQINESAVGILRSYQHGLPVQPRLHHTMVEMRLRANERLNGPVQNFSAIATSILQHTWDGVNFFENATRNPAWIALDILTSEKNPKPLSRAQIDWPSWLHLAAKCDELRTWNVNGTIVTDHRYMCDIVVTSWSTAMDLVESVLSGCRASLVRTAGGLMGVLHDEEKTIPRQLITPANSWGFSGSRTYSARPHAFRVNFVNRDNGWNTDEIVVYADGYGPGNATEFESLDSGGITDWWHAWAFGRYMMAQGLLRSEIFTVSMDVENLLVQRGEMVHVAHDVPQMGGVPARIQQIAATGVSGGMNVYVPVLLSAPVAAYSVRRNVDGSVITGRILNQATFPGDEGTWLEIENFAGVEADDLIVLGDLQRVVFPYLVQSIAPGDDLSATLSLVRYDARVYQADQGLLPPWDPGLSFDYINRTDLRVVDLQAHPRFIYRERLPFIEMDLVWRTEGAFLKHHEVTVITPSGLRHVLSADNFPQSFEWIVDALKDQEWLDIPLQFEVVPISTSGLRGTPGYVTATLLRDRTPPPPVPVFGVNIQKEQATIFWREPDAPDIDHYQIRYTPNAITPNWNAAQHLATVAWPTDKITTGSRTGAFGVRAVDSSGNVGDVVWRRTTVGELADINVIEVVDDRQLMPPWPGKVDGGAQLIGAEVLSGGAWGAVAPQGLYLYSQVLDLGQIEKFRVSSKVEAYGVTEFDYMAQWQAPLFPNNLASVPSLAFANSDLWDVILEISTNDKGAVMADWQPPAFANNLASVIPLAQGAVGAWSEWRPVEVGDYQARLARFRLRLLSYHPGVRAVVSGGRIEIDVSDRIVAGSDIPIAAAPTRVAFVPALREVRAVAVTVDGNVAPVTAELLSKDGSGFTVQLKDSVTGNLVAGQIDYLAEGFGVVVPFTI